jgi:hypothetical protein
VVILGKTLERVSPIANGKVYRKSLDWLGRGPKWKPSKAKLADRRLWFHAALDIAAPKGTAVVSPEAGRIVYSVKSLPSGASIFGGYGPQVVVVEGQSGRFHWLTHLRNIIVKRNDTVDPGEQVGEVAYDHVHWEIRTKARAAYKGCKYGETCVPGSLDQEPYPWAITVDPVRWLKGYEVSAAEGWQIIQRGLWIREKYPVILGKTGKEIELPPMEITAKRETKPVPIADKITFWHIAAGLGVIALLYWKWK